MALSRIPVADLFRVTVKQPLQELPPKGFCYISFRAGCLGRKEGKLVADKRKGQVAIVRSDDGSVVLQWFERIAKEDGAAEFRLADEPETDRVLQERAVAFEWFKKDRRILKVEFKHVRRPNQAQMPARL